MMDITRVLARGQTILDQRITSLERIETTQYPVINVRAKGALIDGTDATAAFQAALDDAASQTPMPPVYIPPGVFSVQGKVNVPAGSTIYGHSGRSIVQTPAQNIIVFEVNDGNTVVFEDFVLDGTAIITGGGAEADHVAIRVQNSERVICRGLTARNYTIAILYRTWDSPDEVVPTPVNGWGVHHSAIMNCVLTDNKDGGTALFRNTSHCLVSGNECRRNGTSGITLDDGTVHDETRITPGHPNGIAESPTFNTVIGNITSDNTVVGINLSGIKHCTVTGNVSEHNGVYADLVNYPDGSRGYFGVIRAGYGIELLCVQNHQLCRYNTVSANACVDNRRAGITLLGASSNEISNNVVTDNGDDWHSSPAATGIWLLESASYSIPATTLNYSTTLTVAAAAGTTVFQVASTAGTAAGAGLYLELDSGTHLATRIVHVDSPFQLTMSVAIPAGDSAASGQQLAVPAIHGTTLTAGVVAGNTNMPVVTAAGTGPGRSVRMLLDNGASFSSAITAIPDETHITLTTPIPVGRSAAAGTAIGQIVVSFASDPTLVGQSGPEFTATSALGATVVKTRPANPNELDTEYTTLSAVNGPGHNITLTVGLTRSVVNNAVVWQPMGSVNNSIANNTITRTQAGRQPSGVRIEDKFCIGNAVEHNRIVDLTGNSESNWAPIIDANTGTVPTVKRDNIFDGYQHQGIATLDGASPPNVTVTTQALQANSRVELTRQTAAAVAANTGIPFVISRTNGTYTAKTGTLMNAFAAGGAVTITVLNALDMLALRTIEITLDNGTIHTTTVGGAYAGGVNIPLTAALPSAASIDQSVRVTVPAVTGSFIIRGTVNVDNGQIGWTVSN